ncbi:acyltransferase family protein [Butyrivibrio fibrisolvens]|uniref:acyltransferase family protein n=1 Tax=Butyrivibrio fibrisolvens TaxID=831 RepID=UPI00040F6932|nr:acyltransferase family protein [Butyrivibrio fibrisolvens]
MNNYLSKENTNCIKGILAVLILFHHIYQYGNFLHGSIWGGFLQIIGYLSVSAFFFFSGYGLIVSSKKEKYMKLFIRNRFMVLYIFYVAIDILYSGYFYIINGTFSAKLFLKSLVIGGVVPLGWFLQVTFLVYILWWCVFHIYRQSRKQILLIILFLVIYSVVCIYNEIPNTYYEGVFCVPLGMLCALYGDRLHSVLSSHSCFFAIVNLISFLASFSAWYLLPFGIGIVFRILSTLFFSMVIVAVAYLLQETNIINNKISRTLGIYSLEMYVTQGFMLMLTRGTKISINNGFSFVLIALVGTVMLSITIKPLYVLIRKLIATH